MSGTHNGHGGGAPRRRGALGALAAGLIALLVLVATSAATTPIGTQARISAMGPDGTAPLTGDYAAVAHNPRADQYLVVWQGDAAVGGDLEIWGRLLAADGTPVGGQIRISDMGPDGNPAFDAGEPAVAYNPRADEYLVVWEGSDDGGGLVAGEHEVFAQRLSAAGTEVGPNDLRVSDMGPDGNAAFDAIEATVAYNLRADEYLVAWEGDDDTAPLVDNEREVYAQRLTAAGTEVGANDHRVSDTGPDGNATFDAGEPSVAYNPRADEYLIAWAGDDDTAPLVEDELEIFVQRLGATGAEVGGNDVRVSDMGPDGNPGLDAYEPSVAYNGRADEYLVAWEGDDGTAPLANDESEIFVQRLGATGAEVGPNDVRVSDMGPDGNPAFGASVPSVAYDVRADEYLVAWYGDDDTAPLVDNEWEIFAQRLGATGAEVGGNDVRVSAMGADGNPAAQAFSPAVAVNTRSNEYLIAWDGDDGTPPLVDDEYEVWVRRFGAGPVLAAPEPVCATRPPVTPPAAGDPSRVQLTRNQLLINQRISQAAVRRANAIQAWLDAGLEARDLCGGGIGPAELGPGVVVGWGAILATAVAPTPRAVTVAPAGGGEPGAVTLSRNQLLINQRISQAAVRRANALKARLDGGLTGGDLDDGAVGPAILEPTMRILAATAPATPPEPSRTQLAPAGGGEPGAVRLSRTQLLINQRISQAAVRRANALRERLLTGISGAGVKDGTLSALDLGTGVGP